MKVDLDLIGPAKAAADAGAAHFGGLARDLTLETQSLGDMGAFEGGHGMTGAYHDQLALFGTEWLKMFALFVQDEHDFAAFLTGFAARLEGTHTLYREAEHRIAASLRALHDPFDADRPADA